MGKKRGKKQAPAPRRMTQSGRLPQKAPSGWEARQRRIAQRGHSKRERVEKVRHQKTKKFRGIGATLTEWFKWKRSTDPDWEDEEKQAAGMEKAMLKRR